MQAARLENIFQLQSEPELESWNLFSADWSRLKSVQVSRLEQDIIDHRAGLKGTIVKDGWMGSGIGLIPRWRSVSSTGQQEHKVQPCHR